MQLLWLQVTVNLGNGNAGVAKKFLDLVKRDPILHKPTCKGVPEGMEVEPVVKFGQLDIFLECL